MYTIIDPWTNKPFDGTWETIPGLEAFFDEKYDEEGEISVEADIVEVDQYGELTNGRVVVGTYKYQYEGRTAYDESRGDLYRSEAW